MKVWFEYIPVHTAIDTATFCSDSMTLYYGVKWCSYSRLVVKVLQNNIIFEFLYVSLFISMCAFYHGEKFCTRTRSKYTEFEFEILYGYTKL